MDERPLAYRLRESVRYRQWNGFPILILDFPLKTAVLHRYWGPLFESCADGSFVTFETIVSRLTQVSPTAIEIFLNGLVRKGFMEQEGSPVLSHYPFVSVIIPVRNRPEEIAACLQSLSRIEYPADRMEVIVVDDASEDNTPEIVSNFPVRLIALNEQRGASFCRNLGAGDARGEILAFVDSDCLADPLWPRELIPAFNDSANGAVGGLVDSCFHEKSLDRYEKVKSSLNMGPRPTSSRDGSRFFYLPACNLLVRKSVFQRLNGFREDMVVGEDVDFCYRLQDSGHHVEYRPVGRIYHKHRNTIRHFGLRRFDYGTSEPLLRRTHPGRVKQLVFPPPDIMFWGLILLTLASGWLPLLGLCGLTGLVDASLRFYRIYKKSLPIGFPHILLATFRGYLVGFYHWSSFVSRYYLVAAPLFLLLAPPVGAGILGMHLLTSLGEYFIKKPSINFFVFLMYFTLEQIAYQSGVWRGCFKMLCFGPVIPQIVRRPIV
ncbi:MAG: mycofactocin biosynthesis glycosyltransferase MftF [Syntrophobacter sp.]